MDQPVKLIPLLCLQCSMPIPAEVDEVAWVCSQCGQGVLLNERKGLQVLEVYYSAGLRQGMVGKPYWVAEGQVQVQRQTHSSSKTFYQEAQAFWSEPRRFFVPAFTCSLETLLKIGTELLVAPPALQPGTSTPFEPVTLSVEDVTNTAEFIVMAIEADRKDKLKAVNFSLKLAPPALWILP